jgi:hypothetical protein
MFLPSATPVFGITHPIGLPRPVDPENVFGAKISFFARNVMPVPTGCLEHFDGAVYRPYLQRLTEVLNGLSGGWSDTVLSEVPARYCLLRHGLPATIPAEIRLLLPEPPRVGIAAILLHFDDLHPIVGAPLQLLDVLTMISEDIGPEKFAAATAAHPWVSAFLQ